MNTFNEQKERDEQRGDEYQFGAIATDLAAVPLTDRQSYLPTGVLQYNNVMDTNGCASRGPLNILETKLDYFYDHGMHPAIQKWLDDNGYRVNGKFALCDAFIEILSGTTPQGNSLKAPLQAIQNYGVIPAALIPLNNDMSWDVYMNPARVTQAHKDLGAQFLRRLPIAYEQVPLSQFAPATTEDSLDVAIHAWGNPVDGVYPKFDGPFNHVVDRFTNEIDVFDNYNPFIKRLAQDYIFFDWGYSLSIPNQNPYPDETIALFDVLQKYGLLAYFAEAWKRLMASGYTTFGGVSRSPQWPSVRKTHLAKFPNCAICGGTKKITVHHRRPYHLHPELELDPANLITLCEGSGNGNHHLLFGHWGNFTTKYNPHIDEDVAKWLPRISAKIEDENL